MKHQKNVGAANTKQPRRSVSDSKTFIRGIHDRHYTQGPPPALVQEWGQMEACQRDYAFGNLRRID